MSETNTEYYDPREGNQPDPTMPSLGNTYTDPTLNTGNPADDDGQVISDLVTATPDIPEPKEMPYEKPRGRDNQRNSVPRPVTQMNTNHVRLTSDDSNGSVMLLPANPRRVSFTIVFQALTGGLLGSDYVLLASSKQGAQSWQTAFPLFNARGTLTNAEHTGAVWVNAPATKLDGTANSTQWQIAVMEIFDPVDESGARAD